MKIRRINLYGGPGCGKSTAASRLYGEMKAAHYNVEFIPEYIKSWAYAGRVPKLFDQVYIFSKQMQAEAKALQHVDHIVSESPLLLVCSYAIKHHTPGTRQLVELAMEFEQHYPALHVMLDRDGIEYVQHGRYENYEQALVMDQLIENILDGQNIPTKRVKATDFEQLWRTTVASIVSA